MDKAELKNGRYVPSRELGEGAQGETFEAVDKRDGRLVAIKCFRLGKAKMWKGVELAEREARTLAALDHPKLPKYIEHFEENGALYLVMERIEGESLLTSRRSGRRFTANDALRLLRDVGGALTYLHERPSPIVHRDVKPGNVLRRRDGSFVLVDFGSVRDRLKPEGGSTVAGTFGYMAPEQFQGRALPVSDLYGLGATVLSMLTGQEPEALPHRGLAIDVKAALPAGTPRDLVTALTRMLAPNPDERATSMAEVLRDLAGSGRREDGRARRRERHEEARARQMERRRERRDARIRRVERGPVPFVPRLFATLGLLIARLSVFFAVAVVAPSVLVTLSVFFGPALRRAAAACVRASHRAVGAINDKLEALWDPEPRLGGRTHEEAEDVLRRVRAVTPEEAQRIAIAEAAREEGDAEAWAEERARTEAEAWAEEARAEEEEERLRRRAVFRKR